MKKYLFFLLLLITVNCLGQNTITGRIINKTDKKPAISAVVFLNNTGIKSTTDNDGHFTLSNVPSGEYQLLVTIIGYEDYKMPVTINGNINLPDIEITPKNEVLNEVTIRAKDQLSACYPIFQNEFMGKNLFARQCKILNPHAVLFYDINPDGGFSARSNTFIEVENDALGYKVKFLLNYFIKDGKTSRIYFSGESYFEELKGTASQKNNWQKNRLECYQGSIMQLLRSIITDSVKENGYRIKKAHREDNPYFNQNGIETDAYDLDRSMDFFGNSDNTRFNDKLSNNFLQGKDILLKTNYQDLFAIAGDNGVNNSLYIEHISDNVPLPGKGLVHVPWIWHSTITFIKFDKPYFIFDHDGKVLNPRIANYAGFLTEQTRIATLLPFDYKPM